MCQEAKTAVDYEEEISQLNGIISSYKKELEELKAQRRELLKKQQYVDMDMVLEQILELGLTANEVLELISDAARSR